jgi:hypothetical protein
MIFAQDTNCNADTREKPWLRADERTEGQKGKKKGGNFVSP